VKSGGEPFPSQKGGKGWRGKGRDFLLEARDFYFSLNRPTQLKKTFECIYAKRRGEKDAFKKEENSASPSPWWEKKRHVAKKCRTIPPREKGCPSILGEDD